ncbi:nucleolar and coiled-body phosphoprotein [Anaeramoeba flamelloides]|uniref:Nucleolar and coiled-body phosphoprotein n=1 Tax=Anaeramoeba flamelloides TaxID=1746091 RepID=A0AAV7ZQ73_9EUKA|nr:nucleolar and coiled-body phosphoprotein [Anaeramoeba flamelloides]|eukprot:Anaeramoba_flamelloidesa1053662_516.p1 GENE.a1053662_516~~a1053662_516.p1  ORF type:complete len:803 (+),score=256.60 a1053662_516:939-3347(+)
MFLLSKPVELEKINYDPNLSIDEMEKSKSLRRQAMIFLQEVVQNTALRSSEVFSPNCCVLLNYVNVLRPTQYVKVVKTASKKKQNEENLNEFLKIASQANYKTDSFPKEDYLKGESSSQKEIAKVIIHLKKEYEKKGICPASEKEVRTFFLVESSKSRKNSKNLKNQAVHINPYFVTEKELQDFKDKKSMKFKNIFSKSKKSKLKFINGRKKELHQGENSTDSGLSSMSGSHSNSDSNSNSDSDKEKSAENKSEIGDLLKSADNNDDYNSDNSNSDDQKNSETTSDSNSNSDSEKKKTKKKKGWPKSKGSKKDTDSSSEFDQLKMSSNKSTGTSDNTDSDSEIEKKKRNTKTKKNKKKNTKTKTNKRRKNQTQKIPKSITETLYRPGKYVVRSATLPLQVHTETQQQGKVPKLFKLSKEEGTHQTIPLPINEENIYIAKNINKHFKTSKQKGIVKDPKKREYIHLIYYIINTIDKWEHNSKKQSSKYLKECGFKNLPLLFNQAYLDTVNLGKNGHAMFQVMITKNKNQKSIPAIMELTTQNFKIRRLKDRRIMVSQHLSDYPFQIALNKLDPSEISLKNLEKPKDNYLLKFSDSIQCICGVMALAYFFTTTIENLKNGSNKQTKSKNFAKTINKDFPFIGKNPPRAEHSKNIEDLAKCVMPPLVSPNEKFNQLLSGTNLINLKVGKKQIMRQYMEQGGVNFLVALLNRNEFPLTSGYFKIRKSYFKVGTNGATLFKIPWKAKPSFFVNPKNKLVFSIDWTPSATCSTSKETSIIVVCSRNSERSLITNALTYFKANSKPDEN